MGAVLLVLLVLVGCLPWPTRLPRRSRSRRSTPVRRARACPVAVLGHLASLTRAGLSVPDALHQVCVDLDDTDPFGAALIEAAARAGRGESAAEPLRAVTSLRGLALTLAVLEASGGPVAEALQALVESAADSQDAEGAITAALAGPTATARLLVALPLIGLLLGHLMGADPFGVLFTTGSGRVCLVVGVLGCLGGWWWSRRLVQAAR